MAQAKDKIKIALIDLEPQGVTQDEARAITDRVHNELIQTGKFTVLERSMVEKVLEERGFQLAVGSPNNNIAEAGKILGVERMVVGSVSKLGQLYSISLRMIDVSSGEIVASSTADVMSSPIEQLALESSKEAVQKLIGTYDEASAPKKNGKKTWLYVSGGAVVVGAAAFFAFQGGDEGNGQDNNGRLVIRVPKNP